MKLIPFKKEHYPILINWIKDAQTLFLFAGIAFQFPLTEQQLDDYILAHPDRKLYLALNEDHQAIAFGEIIPQDVNSARIAHLIVGENSSRGKGLGQKLISILNQEGKSTLNIQTMDLYVLESNDLAINCYLKSGFQFIPNDFAISFQNQKYQVLKMTKSL